MDFYTLKGLTRPVRLCEATRAFAYDSLHRKYGTDTLKTDAVPLDHVAGFDKLSPLEQYDLAIEEIARNAPIRICEGELISGAATLGMGIHHRVPATYGGKSVFGSVSHLTVDFETVLKIGVNGIRVNAEAAYQKYRGTDKEPFSKSCLRCLDAFSVWHGRYLEALGQLPGYGENYKNLKRVPFEPPTSFYEAVQSIWFTFAFIRLCGNWPGIGRIDWLLGEYLKKDLASGEMTLDRAREILAHFFIKGCEWINGKYIGSGDAQHYQNLVLGGIDGEGQEITNEVTYLILDVLEELGISDYPTTVRVSKNTDETLLRRVAEVMRHGGGTLAIYGEDTVLEALRKDGYPPEERWKFANDGCWEVQIPGRTHFNYIPFDGLQILQKDTLGSYGSSLGLASFEELYQKYREDLRRYLESDRDYSQKYFLPQTWEDGSQRWRSTNPCTVVSLFEEGCVRKGLSYYEGGPVYYVRSPHIGGFADIVNSLYAIKKLVFDENKVTLDEFLRILRSNWEGEEALRQYAMTHYSYYGNDNAEVDELSARLAKDFADICRSLNGRSPLRFNAGISTFGRQLNWAPERLASPHGRRVGEVLAANTSPTPGTDKEGATAIIRSYCRMDLTELATGAALDIRLLPSSVMGEDGVQALMGLIRGFVALGGFFMQVDVADAEVLKAAQECPECYPTLSVRVSGWNARFVTLNKQWQDMVIVQNGGETRHEATDH